MTQWPWKKAGEGIAAMVKAGADLSAKDDEGKTPLHYLAGLGQKSPMFFIHGIGEVFSATNVNIDARDNHGDTPLHIAVRTGTGDVFKWLVGRGANLDATNNAGETPRMLATRNQSFLDRFGGKK
jgi:ankyrin repeat protein